MSLNEGSELLVYYVLELHDCFGDEVSIYAGAASPDGRTKLIRVNKNMESDEKKVVNNINYINMDMKKVDEESENCIKIEDKFIPEYPFNPAEIKVAKTNIRAKPGFFC